MDAIYLPQLAKAPDQTECLQVKESLSDLETLTPVQGWLKAVHRGDYLEISTDVNTIVTLGCDRCLQHYNHRLSIQVSELIWFESAQSAPVYDPGAEIEVPLEELIETLDPEGYFDPSSWLYEQLCLEIPLQKLCDTNCEGIVLKPEDSDANISIDHRWAALESLKNQL